MNELDSLRHEHAELHRRLELAETDRQRLEALVRTSPVGMLVIDSKTRAVVLVNEEAERIIGMPDTLAAVSTCTTRSPFTGEWTGASTLSRSVHWPYF